MLLIELLLWMLGLCLAVAPWVAALAVLWGTVRLAAYVVEHLRRRRELSLERDRAAQRIEVLKNQAITRLLDVEHIRQLPTASDIGDGYVAALKAATRIEECAASILDASSRETP
jgi:hypothetical protein